MNLDYATKFLIFTAILAIFMSFKSFKNWTLGREPYLGIIGWLLVLFLSGMALELINKLKDCINH